MNRFTIFYLSTLSYLSFTSAQEETKEYCKITGAHVDDDSEEGSQTFDQDDLFLYKTVYNYKGAEPTYSIRDGSGKQLYRHEFSIRETSTIVIEGAIITKCLSRRIMLTMDGNAFELHQNMFPLKIYEKTYRLPVDEAFQGDNELQNVDGLRTKKGVKYWVCTVLEGSEPRLIFPTTAVVLEPSDGRSSVSFTIKSNEDIPMRIKFNYEVTADEFRKVVKHGARMLP